MAGSFLVMPFGGKAAQRCLTELEMLPGITPERMKVNNQRGHKRHLSLWAHKTQEGDEVFSKRFLN